MYNFIRDESIQEFINKAGPLLYKDEPTNSLMLGLCEGMLTNPPKNSPLLVRVVKDNETVSAAIQTPPMNLVITYTDQVALAELVKVLKNSNADFPGVVGPAKESELFANEWSKLIGKKTKLGMGQKIYRLDEVRFPSCVEGSFRPASADEAEIVFDWIIAFAKESLPASDQRGEEHWRMFAQNAVQKQTAHFWIYENQPVSIAFVSRPTRHGVSLNGVYTPAEFRKNGFASAVVAHLSQKMLDAGKEFCVLYTDLSNPTSNKIYQEIGYREVSDSKHFLFE
ncbi:MAG: GNAT family N-acetyltransferase [Bdellovibrionales bacterium]|nr:GNAT family N-acetyltransferase [Bdellovibrionales bacterium]